MIREITDLNELKTIQLRIMKIVHTFCVENDIRYYLAYGTLIGAMRHSGFIPWDDDIDVFMPRPDYERFLKIFDEYGSKHHLKICNYKTKPFYCRPMSKVFDQDTVLVEPEYKYDDKIGVFIDIWPLDGISDNQKIQTKEINKLMRIRYLLYKKIVKFFYNKKLRDYFLAPLCKIFVNHKKMTEKMDSYLAKYNYDESKTIVCVSLPTKIMLREWFEPSRLVPFEDAFFFVPNNYDEILTPYYGDWRKLPPIEKQVPHHITNVWKKE